MNLFKIVAFLLGLVVAAVLAISVLGMAFALLKLAAAVADVCSSDLLLVGGLWKLFGGNGGDSLPPPQRRLDNIELTMDEYKRKLEAQIKPQEGKDWKS